MGYLPEQPPLYPEMTVQEYLDFAAELKGIKKKADRKEQVQPLPAAPGWKKCCPGSSAVCPRATVSAWALRRHCWARRSSSFWTSLPSAWTLHRSSRSARLIRELGKSHTVILSSHILSEVQAVCQQVLILSKGRLVAVGPGGAG